MGKGREHTDGHRDSMKESAKGRFFENTNNESSVGLSKTGKLVNAS